MGEIINIHKLKKAQDQFFQTHVTKSYDFRILQLKKLKKLVKDNQDLICEALSRDLARDHFDSFLIELSTFYSEISYMIKNLKKYMKTKSASTPIYMQPGKGKVIAEPYGVTCIFAPWNYPVMLLLSPLVGSIAAGNCTLLKPSDVAKNVQALMCKLINENFDNNYIHCIGGSVSECNELLKEHFDFIFFTGSTEVGKIVLKEASKNLTPVCLELGGKSPCIVSQNSNIEIAAKKIAWGKYINAGQTCIAPDYIYVHKSVEEKFLTCLSQYMDKFYTKTPKTCKNFARIISDNHFKRLHRLIDTEHLYYGGELDENDKYISPTVLKDVNWDMNVMKEEIFGPILPVLTYDSLENVCKTISDRPKPLSLYIFSNDRSEQDLILSQTSSGGGCINDCILHIANHNLPFGGVGASGLGSYHGKKSFEVFSHYKAFHHSYTFFDNNTRYIPHTSFKQKLIKFFFK